MKFRKESMLTGKVRCRDIDVEEEQLMSFFRDSSPTTGVFEGRLADCTSKWHDAVSVSN